MQDFFFDELNVEDELSEKETEVKNTGKNRNIFTLLDDNVSILNELESVSSDCIF